MLGKNLGLFRRSRENRERDEAFDTAQAWLANSARSIKRGPPGVFMERDWSDAVSPVKLFHNAHLGLMVEIQEVAIEMGGTSGRRNAGLLGLARILKVDGAELELRAGQDGTFLRTCHFLPPSVSRAASHSQAVMRRLLQQVKTRAKESQQAAAPNEGPGMHSDHSTIAGPPSMS